MPSAEWLANETNQRAFAGCGVASFPAQSNQPACDAPGCGVTQICEIMLGNASATPLERLAALAEAQARGGGGGPRMTSDCEMDWEMPGDVGDAATNYWGYQCCTEYGFFQTCEAGTDCFYARGLVAFDGALVAHRPNDFCAGFGIDTNATAARIAATNAKFDARVANATRILWVNGDVDPWRAASNLESPGDEQPVIFPVRGAHHCAWMAAAADTDQQSVKDARAEIFAQLDAWLAA